MVGAEDAESEGFGVAGARCGAMQSGIRRLVGGVGFRSPRIWEAALWFETLSPPAPAVAQVELSVLGTHLLEKCPVLRAIELQESDGEEKEEQ